MSDQSFSRRDFLKLGAAVGAAAALPAAGPSHAQTAFRGTLPKVFCRKVVSADTLIVTDVGNVGLLGIRGPAKDSEGYQKAVDAVLKYAGGKEILLDLGPELTQTNDGRFRGLVYYLEDGLWYCLNTKMLRAGLASAVTEPDCFTDTSGWVQLVQEAKKNNRGLYHLGVPLAETAEPLPLRPPPPPPPPRPTTPPPEYFEPWVPPHKRPRAEPAAVGFQVKYVGSLVSNRFHRPNCDALPKELDRVLFEGREQALKRGFKECLICRP